MSPDVEGMKVRRPHLLLALLVAYAVAALLFCANAAAATSREYLGSFAAFPGGSNPVSVAVDQTSGDVYVISREPDRVDRFDSTGTPKNFTAGPDAGTNTLTGFNFGGNRGDVAIDNSGGPLDGHVYVTDTNKNLVKIYASTGEQIGSIDGTGTFPNQFGISVLDAPNTVTVDQGNGDLYIGDHEGVWRYVPTSPNGALSDTDYAVTGLDVQATSLGAQTGHVYITRLTFPGAQLGKYAASSFSMPPSSPSFTAIEEGENGTGFSDGKVAWTVDVDPGTTEVYLNVGDEIRVYDTDGSFLYRFGRAAEFGNDSEGIAVQSASSGPAEKVYVADRRAGGHEIETYGGLTKVPVFTYQQVAHFGPNGTPESSFGTGLQNVAFEQGTRRLFVAELKSVAGGIATYVHGFGASSPPSFSPLTGFSPLIGPEIGPSGNIAVDSSGLGSAGRVYLASAIMDLVYGYSSSGSELGPPFPIDPAVAPGGPIDICGATVDSSGGIWIANRAAKRILRYDSAGTYLSAVDVSAQGAPCELAVASNGDLYVAFETGIWKYTAASSYSSTSQIAEGRVSSITVDPASGHLYAVYSTWIDEYDSDGKLIDEFAKAIPEANFAGIAVDSVNGHLYLADRGKFMPENPKAKIRVFAPGVLLPDVATLPPSPLTNTSATLRGTVTSQEVALTGCHFEYVTETAFRLGGFSDLSSGGSVPCSPAHSSIPLDLDEHVVRAAIGGLTRNAEYRFRLVASNAEGSSATPEAAFTATGPPDVETVGSPMRTATTAELGGRVNPRGAATTYRFEYGSEGPCESNPCESTAPRPVGSGVSIQLVSQRIEGLQPDTTYHYRLVADNANTDGPSFGEDMTLTTRASDAPLSRGPFPGPPGSDRAWEQVNLPDTGGNPVITGVSASDDGERVIYQISGGTPIADSGSGFSQLFAERTHKGWISKQIAPPREEVTGSSWYLPLSDAGLSQTINYNFSFGGGIATLWRLVLGGPPVKLFQEGSGPVYAGIYMASGDASRVVARLGGAPADAANPVSTEQLYDISTGDPQLATLMPGNQLPTCAVPSAGGRGELLPSPPARASRWLSDDGSLLFFPSPGTGSCTASKQIYVRDFDAGQTQLISGPPLSGPSCVAAFIKSTSDAAFFWTQSRLDPDDTAAEACSSTPDGDVYRYDLEPGTLECLTCLADGLDADVALDNGQAGAGIAVASDGSRLYFTSPNRLLPGAASPGTYRLKIGSGELDYVAPGGTMPLGDFLGERTAMTPDGAVIAFASSSSALNPVGGLHNGNTLQYYRYDDRDRSLVCVSCPLDGSPAPMAADGGFGPQGFANTGPNSMPLSHDGVVAFATPNALVAADQNTAKPGQESFAGMDVYEWRDGRVLLVTDGLTKWPSFGVAPIPNMISPSGRDIFFTASAQYTPDALDSYNRIYDARIGGGIEFPQPPQPCPLEVCQGTPKGVPEEVPPASSSFSGAGNAPAVSNPRRACRKGKVRRRGRCVAKRRNAAKQQRRRANDHRRTAR